MARWNVPITADQFGIFGRDGAAANLRATWWCRGLPSIWPGVYSGIVAYFAFPAGVLFGTPPGVRGRGDAARASSLTASAPPSDAFWMGAWRLRRLPGASITRDLLAPLKTSRALCYAARSISAQNSTS